LRVRMTIFYTLTTLAAVLLVELLLTRTERAKEGAMLR
jgi:hypothetical protein